MMLLNAPAPDPGFVWQLILVVALLASMGANISTVMSNRKTQKREVSFGFVPASKEEFDKHVVDNKREHENIFSKLGGVERGGQSRMDAISKEWREFVDSKFDDMARASEQGREKLHERINAVLGEMKEMKGEMKTLARNV